MRLSEIPYRRDLIFLESHPMAKTKRRKFVTPNRDQLLLLPPDVGEWVAEDHLSRWIIKAVESLDLKPFYKFYDFEGETTSGRPPYDPAMMLTMVFYALANRQASSRRIEAMTYNDLGARLIMANQHPDHSVFAKFRDNHKEHMEWAFSQVLLACHEAGLVDLSYVAIDSTIIKANASVHKSVAISELEDSLAKAMSEAARLLAELDSKDAQDREELERKLKNEQSRLAGFRRALEFLKARGQASGDDPVPAAAKPQGKEERTNLASSTGAILRNRRLQKGLTLHLLAEMTQISTAALSRYENGMRLPCDPLKGRIAQALGIELNELPSLRPPAETAPKPNLGWINPIDLDSYLIKRKHTYYQGYLSQAAVTGRHQIIVAAGVSPTNTDQPFLRDALNQMHERLGMLPKQVTADSGYCSESNFHLAKTAEVDFLSPPGRLRKGAERRSEAMREMEERLSEPAAKKSYNRRAPTVEAVFGNLKSNQGFTHFFVRGLAKVKGDWFQKMAVHNLMKLFRVSIL